MAQCVLIILHSERLKLNRVFAFLSAMGLREHRKKFSNYIIFSSLNIVFVLV